jgi:hypothetical protein
MGHNAPSNALLLLSLPVQPAHKAISHKVVSADKVGKTRYLFNLSASRALSLPYNPFKPLLHYKST